jgi:hypothetical protein
MHCTGNVSELLYLSILHLLLNVEFIAFILLQGFPRLIVHFLEVLKSCRDWTVCMDWDVPRAVCGLGYGDACAEENAMHRNLSELLSNLACESSAAFIAFVFHADTRLTSPRSASLCTFLEQCGKQMQ